MTCNFNPRSQMTLAKSFLVLSPSLAFMFLKIAKLSSLYKPMSPFGNIDDNLCRMYRATTCSSQTLALSQQPMATSNIGESPLLTLGSFLSNRRVFLQRIMISTSHSEMVVSFCILQR